MPNEALDWENYELINFPPYTQTKEMPVVIDRHSLFTKRSLKSIIDYTTSDWFDYHIPQRNRKR